MIECRLLYSVDDMREFQKFPLCDSCKLSSMPMDGQKVFIVAFDSKKAMEVFDRMFENIHPTMIGCIETDRIDLQDENIETLKSYIREFESKEDIVAFMHVNHHRRYG